MIIAPDGAQRRTMSDKKPTVAEKLKAVFRKKKEDVSAPAQPQKVELYVRSKLEEVQQAPPAAKETAVPFSPVQPAVSDANSSP